MRALNFLLSWPGRFVLIAGVLGAMVGGRALFGHADGEPCSDGFLCSALPARCIRDASGSFCSRPCKDASKCKTGWTCAPVERIGDEGPIESEMMCIKPGTKPPFSVRVRR